MGKWQFEGLDLNKKHKLDPRSKKRRKAVALLALMMAACFAAGIITGLIIAQYTLEVGDIPEYKKNPTPSPEQSSTPEPTSEATPSPTPTLGWDPTEYSDENNYRNQYVNINIEKAYDDDLRCTMFIADIMVANMDVMFSAFGQDKFGTYREKVSDMAERMDAVIAINADYYGYNTDKKGILIRNGLVYRDEPERDGVAFLKNGEMIVFDESEYTAEELLAMGAIHTFSFGPILVKDGEVYSDLTSEERVNTRNPRTAIGMLEPYHFIFVVVDGRAPGYSDGVTMENLAELMKNLGCQTAYNFDGGQSSSMWFNGKTINKICGDERRLTDALMIMSSPDHNGVTP
jgi:exopolysaccharide biosynthesis protein